MKRLLVFIIWQMGLLVLFAQQTTQLIVSAPVLAPEDSLELFIQPKRIGKYFNNPAEILFAENKNGSFKFSIENLKDATWVSLCISYQKLGDKHIFTILDEFHLNSGDSIVINLYPKTGYFRAVEDGYVGNIPVMMESWDADFSGVGATKFQANWELKNLNSRENRQKILVHKFNGNEQRKVEMLEYIREEAKNILMKYENMLDEVDYHLIKAQFNGGIEYEMGRVLEQLLKFSRGEEVKVSLDKLDLYLARGKKSFLKATDLDAKSPKFIDFLTQYTWLQFVKQYKPGGNVIKDWYDLSKSLRGPCVTRDRVLTSLLMQRFQDDPQQALLDDALSSFQDPFSFKQTNLLRSLLDGVQGYAFYLPDVNGEYYKAADYIGKVVFMDFWYASCGPCQQYMRDVVGPVKKIYKDNPNVVFITVSTDDLETFKVMLNKDDFLPKGGVHLYTEGQYFKHPIIKHYQIQSYPYPLLIGKDGKLLAGKFKLSQYEGLKEGIDWALKQ